MKKVLLLAVAGVFVLASCAKDRTCECKNSTGTYTEKTTVKGVTKKFMQENEGCVSYETTKTSTNATTGTAVVTVDKQECELK